MTFEVSFSRKAKIDFKSILNYIAIEFGEKSADNFKKLVMDFATLLENSRKLEVLN